MLDTLKLGIPLSQYQLARLRSLIDSDDSWQWVQHQRSTGDIRFARRRGLAKLDSPSFHREVFWDVPDSYIVGETFLTIELSVPKFWYGTNIHLLYSFVEALSELKKILEKILRCRFVDVLQWQVFRVDVCYAWRCPDQRTAQMLLDALKHLHYPRKRPVIYPTAIMFTGGTYSLKFYLKLPEFLHHDRKALLKSKASLEWVEHLEQKATGVLRCEATLRRKYLKRRGILTIKELAVPTMWFEPTVEFSELNHHVLESKELFDTLVASIILDDDLYESLEETFNSISNKELFETDIINNSLQILEDGELISSPPAVITTTKSELKYNGGSLVVRKEPSSVELLNYFITKFLGESRIMQTADEVQAALLEKYKPLKAAQLASVWLYVNRFGTNKAKELFGKNYYYRARRAMKEAGVSFVEPPKTTAKNVLFLRDFDFKVPSPYVTNAVDDFRDSDNVLNLHMEKVESSDS